MKKLKNLEYYLIAAGVAIAIILPQYTDNSTLDVMLHIGGIMIAALAGEIANYLRKELK